MNLSDIRLIPYKLPFKESFRFGRSVIPFKKGFFLEALSDEGFTALGELAPFPQLGSETYKQVIHIFPQVVKKLKNKTIPQSYSAINSALTGLEDYPATRFAFEQIFVSLLMKTQPQLKEFSQTASQILHTNAIIPLYGKSQAIQAAVQYIDNGYTRLKIKIGRNNFNEDLDIIRNISQELPNGTLLRLDGNGSWSLADAEKYCHIIEAFPVEYIEQPVKDVKDLVRLAQISKVQIAADESLHQKGGFTYLLNNPGIKFFICKPLLLGGYMPLISIKQKAENAGITCLISSSLESPLGLNYLAWMASHFPNSAIHGLGTTILYDLDLPDLLQFKNKSENTLERYLHAEKLSYKLLETMKDT